MSKDIFLSKKNTLNLFKNIVNQNNFKELKKDKKQIIVDLLIKNMKKVYKSIDTKKLNKNNIDSILKQFNQLSMNETNEKIKEMHIFNNTDQLSDRKFKRDFESQPDRKVSFMERPETQSTHTTDIKEKNLDSFYQTMKPSQNTQNYGSKKSIADKMLSLQKMRNSTNKRETKTAPEFIQSQPTQETSDEYNLRMKSQSNEGFQASNFNTTDDFISLNDMNNKIKPDNLEFNDHRSLDQRLEELQSNRDLIGKPKISNNSNEASVDEREQQMMQMRNNLTDSSKPLDSRETQMRQMRENLSNDTMITKDEAPNFDNLNKIQKIPMNTRTVTKQIQPSENYINQQNQQFQQLQIQQQMNNELINNFMKQMQEQMINKSKQEEKKNLKISNLKVKDDSSCSEINAMLKKNRIEYSNIIRKLLKKIDLINDQNQINVNKLKSKIYDLEKTIKKLKENNDNIFKNVPNKNVKDLMTKINEKFVTLKEENKKLNDKKLEFESNKNNLDKKINAVNNLYNKLSPDNSSQYDFKFSQIDNVIGIKLISYSIPQLKFNINENINNILRLKIKNIELDEEKNNKESTEIVLLDDFMNKSEVIVEIKLESGHYTINSLLKKINNFLEINYRQYNIKLKLDDTHKINIESDNNFKILETNLSHDVFGFLNENDYSKSVLSDRPCDLRVPDKLYIYLNNIQQNVPFGIVYFNKISQSEIKFQNPVSLDNLNIKFLDTGGNLYNFNNLNHTLNFKLEILNRDDKFNNLTSDLNSINYTDKIAEDDKDSETNEDNEDYDTQKLNNILNLIDNM